MSTVVQPVPNPLLVAWLDRLASLFDQVRQWTNENELDLPTRLIEVNLKDSEIGRYKAPGLLIQDDAVKILLEPIARSAPGAEGVVDLYLMPAYDDIASLYLTGGVWHLHYMFPDSPTVGNIRAADGVPLTKASFQKVLEAMKSHAI